MTKRKRINISLTQEEYDTVVKAQELSHHRSVASYVAFTIIQTASKELFNYFSRETEKGFRVLNPLHGPTEKMPTLMEDDD